MSKVLQVGDKIYRNDSYGGLYCIEIKRVTEKTAFGEHASFRREEKYGAFPAIGGSNWYAETPEYIAQMKRQNLERRFLHAIKNTDVSRASTAKLQRIVDILNEGE